jgi:hypothetical protein
LLDRELRKTCLAAPIAPDTLYGVRCRDGLVTVTLYAVDVAQEQDTDHEIEMISRAGRYDCGGAGVNGSFGVGGWRLGYAIHCQDRGFFAWSARGVVGRIEGQASVESLTRDWFIEHRPIPAEFDGPFFGIGEEFSSTDEEFVFPRVSFKRIAPSAKTLKYTTLLRNSEDYQDRLVRYKGMVAFIDGGRDIYVDVTPIGSGFYKDTLLLRRSGVDGTLIPGDVIEFVGVMDGAYDSVIGFIPDLVLVAYVLR